MINETSSLNHFFNKNRQVEEQQSLQIYHIKRLKSNFFNGEENAVKQNVIIISHMLHHY